MNFKWTALTLFLVLAACNKVDFQRAQNLDSGGPPIEPPNPPQPRSVSSTFTIRPQNNQVDILFVIDNSGSMGVEQAAMSARLSTFTQKIESLDWRIAITSTDPGEDLLGTEAGRLLTLYGSNNKYLTKTVPNYGTIFANKVNLGDTGSGEEMGIYSSLNAINRNEVNWMRDTADFAIVLLSDEDENSDGSDLDTSNLPSTLVDYFQLRYPSKNFGFHSIVILDETCRSTQGSQSDGQGGFMPAAIGRNYIEASRLTSGIRGSICSTNYANQLSSIGERILQSRDRFGLECAPYGGVVQVSLSTGSVPSYRIEGNDIIFASPLPEGTTVTFNYKCL